MYLRLRRL